MKDAITYQVEQLLRYNKIHFDQNELAFQIQSHPSFPSLHAITGVLSHFNIDNVALTIPKDFETLEQLPKSFLAQIKTEQGKEFLVVNKNKTHCTILTSKKKQEKITNAKFLKKFTGIIVAVEKDELLETSSPKYNFDKILLFLSFILFISLFTTSTVSVSFLIYFGLGLVGVFVSLAIIQQEHGEQTVLGNTFCSDSSEKKDCNAVINSKGALIFNNFKLSNISLVYFVGFTLTSFLLFLQGNNFNILYAISLIALPITAYSIYYQAIVIKKWCLLCMGIVGVIWVQAAIVIANTTIVSAFSFTTKTILFTSFGFLITATLWNYISPKLKSLKKLNQTRVDYFKFKRNFSLFNTLLEKKQQINTSIDGISEIVIGNKNTPLHITIITNPFCGHCKSVHTLIEDIYRKYPKEAKITIRFNINTIDKESDGVKVCTRLIELYHENDVLLCLDAMHDIYDGMKTEDWLNKWTNCHEKEIYLSVLNNESEWCKSSEINFTPEILINGHFFPREYDRSDLIYFIEDLAECCIQDSNTTYTQQLEKQL